MSKSERRIFKSPVDLQSADIRALYDGFIAPIATLYCGQKCAPNNSNGKPFCCDICHAVPAAYTSEWDYLRTNTNLWHAWREDECAHSGSIEAGEDAPEGMLFLACLGPTQCQRDFRALSCRQFPFFPYVTSDYRFVGLAAEWVFEPVCWVSSSCAPTTIYLPFFRMSLIIMPIILNSCELITARKNADSRYCIVMAAII
jgi:hypothetical protein